MRIIEPEVGCWYESALDELQFEVVAIDEDDETIEIQYFDGDVEELELDSWYRMELTDIPAPEDWSGPYEVEPEERNKDNVIHPDHWNALSEFEGDED